MIIVKKDQILESHVDLQENRELLTKAQVWDGFGPDPYPNRFPEDHVISVFHGELLNVRFKTSHWFKVGDLIELEILPGRPARIVEIRATSVSGRLEYEVIARGGGK